MKTEKNPRFDVQLLTIGHDKQKLEFFLQRVKGLASSPSEILNSCPCTIAANISGGASKKLKYYLEAIGAKVLIQASKNSTSTSLQKTRKSSGLQPSNLPQTMLVHKEALPVQTSDVPSLPTSAQKHSAGNTHPSVSQVSQTAPPSTEKTVTGTTITLKRSLNDLIKALQDKEWTVRENAVIELGEIPSDTVVHHIIKALKDDVWRVRYTTLDVLSKKRSDMVIKEITKYIHDDVWHVRYQAVEALGRMESDKVVKPLMPALDDQNWQVRQRAIDVLGDLRSKRALGSLIACLQDDVWQVRESAAQALAKMRSDKSVKALTNALHDSNWNVRSMAVTALWKIGSERAADALIDRIGDENWMVHWKAAYALGKICSANILSVLTRMEKETNSFLSETSQKVLSSLEIVAEPIHETVPRLEYCSENSHPKMIYVPPGYFIMGHDDDLENARPAHQVYLDGFFIDAYEVTNSQYTRFNSSHEYLPEEEFYPVVNVTWEEANEYAKWIGKRLPTEAEWEKAARGNDGKIYPWGNEFDPLKCNTEESGNRCLTPANYYPRGKSCFGVYDMIGNVLEWTAEFYKPYPMSQYDSPDFAEDFIVLRGGSWLHQGIRSTGFTRMYAPVDNRSNFIGFRCVKDLT